MEKMTMSVKELGQQMGISLPKAYELVESEGFPKIQVGRRKVIPIEGFRHWLEMNSQNSLSATKSTVQLLQTSK